MARSKRIKQLVNRSLYLRHQLHNIEVQLDKAQEKYNKYYQQHTTISTDDIDNVFAHIKQLDQRCAMLQAKFSQAVSLEYHTRSELASILKELKMCDITIDVSDKVTILPLNKYHKAVTIVVKD